MGTRNLTIVKVDGKTKIAQYGQWDGYPTGQGKTVAEFLQNMDLEKFKDQVRSLKWITNKKLEDRWVEAGADRDSDHVSMAIADKFTELYPWLSRDVGAQVLDMVHNGVYVKEELMMIAGDYQTRKIVTSNIKVDRVKNDRAFLKDTLFCEYAYEIDLDKEVVKFYAGSTKPFKTVAFKDFTPEYMEFLQKEVSNDRYGDEESA